MATPNSRRSGSPIRNALTVDLEEYFHVSNFESLLPRDGWSGLPSRVEAATERLLRAFEDTSCRATFFVLGWIAARHPSLVQRIAAHGHEIACHGHGHQLVYEIGPERFREDVRRARGEIADACGLDVRGYRAPSYSITARSLWALDVLADEGFWFDSSIFPIRHYRYGIPGFPRRPVRIGLGELGSGRSIVEFPLTTLPLGPLTLPLAGGAYLRFFPEAVFRWGYSRLVTAGEPTVLYTHPWELDPDQPRPAGASWRIRVNHYHNLGRTEDRLRSLLSRFEFAPMGEVLRGLEDADALDDHTLAGPRQLAA